MLQVTAWVNDWVSTVPKDLIKDAFTKCGILPYTPFAQMHAALQRFLTQDFSELSWEEKYEEFMTNGRPLDINELRSPKFITPDDAVRR